MIVANTGGDLVQNFNPFLNGSVNSYGQFGPIYETLMFFNRADGTSKGWLADSATYSSDATQITFKLHPGIKWTDGQPFTASDVVFTFNVMKQYDAADYLGITSSIDSVSSPDPQTVVIKLNSPDSSILWLIGGQTWIVPEHIWSKVGDPTKYTDDKPVGTGPYTISRARHRYITYKANPHYWQPGLPKVRKIQYPAYTSNNTANDDLANGSAQWGGQYIPGIKAFYTAKSPNYQYWFPPTVNVTLIPNLTDPQLKNVKVRQAISYAINRSQVSYTGESGYEPPANQTGIVTPTFASSLNQPALSSWGNGYDPAKAKSLLAQAGYHMSGGVMTNAAGQKLAFTVNNIGDYSDWVASMQVIAAEPRRGRHQAHPAQPVEPRPPQRPELRQVPARLLRPADVRPERVLRAEQLARTSANTAPIGKQAATNYERYSNPKTDDLLDQYTTHHGHVRAAEHPEQIQEVMVSDVPIIPVIEAVDWFQYDTGTFSGWPTPGNPYAQPSPYTYPDN